MQISAKKLAQLLNGVVEGDEKTMASKASKIEEATSGSISFLSNPKYESYAYTTGASILLVAKDFEPKQAVKATMIRVEDVYKSVAFLLQQFGNEAKRTGISEGAHVDDTADVGVSVYVGAFTVVGKGAKIGEGSQIESQVTIGDKVKIGKNVHIYPGVRIYKECEVGDNCILHSNVVVGSDGFGFAPNPDGSYSKIPQVGNVVIENDVEVGSNTTIDRATMGSTIIRKGAKLDSLLMIAHNVEIGQHTVIAAQAGIAGSTKIGQNCVIGGQVGIVGHVEIANGTQVQAQSGINKSLKKENGKWYGSPVIPYMDFLKSFSIFRKLPKIEERLRNLEKNTPK
jgi:UDP-3-O-[3-hydroxymyristoyl] glucosamine N-acyltransferase